MLEGSYEIEANCRNCGLSARVGLSKGTKVTDALCPECGCRELERTNHDQPVPEETGLNDTVDFSIKPEDSSPVDLEEMAANLRKISRRYGRTGVFRKTLF